MYVQYSCTVHVQYMYEYCIYKFYTYTYIIPLSSFLCMFTSNQLCYICVCIESIQIPILRLGNACGLVHTLVYSSYCVSINAGLWPNLEMFAAIFPPKRNPPVGFLARCSHGVFWTRPFLDYSDPLVTYLQDPATGSAVHQHGRCANQNMRPISVLTLDIYPRFLRQFVWMNVVGARQGRVVLSKGAKGEIWY